LNPFLARFLQALELLREQGGKVDSEARQKAFEYLTERMIENED
jgi:hypothetical protein